MAKIDNLKYDSWVKNNCESYKDVLYDDVEESSYIWKGEPTVFTPEESPDLSKPLAVDLFCGLGGLSLGLKNAGFEIVLGADMHVPSVETFKRSHPRSSVIMGDIREALSCNLILSTLIDNIGNKDIDVLMAGIPCQGFSIANRKRHPLDKRNHLFVYFLEAVKLLKPKYVIVENVESIKSFNNGFFVDNILQSLNKEGYNAEYRILNSADYGVPQTRKRIFFIGAREGFAVIWPQSKFGTPQNPHRTVYDAISDLPIIEAGERSKYYPGEPLTEYQRLMRQDSFVVYNHVAPKHPRETINKISNTEPGEPMYENYKQRIRLCWNKTSPTQLSGGIRPQFQFGHPEQARGLTVRERCRIQSIPDKVYIEGQVVQGRVQTGNAVPPMLAEELGKSIIHGLNSKIVIEELSVWGQYNRREFPWREMYGDPYRTLITEMLLRKTKAENVAKVYNEFMHKFPDFKSILAANKGELVSTLKPLGLSKTRAESMILIAKELSEKYDGNVPMTIDKLINLPHIGRYTASAFLLFGFNKRVPIVDANVQRLLNRVFGINTSNELHKHDYMWDFFERIMPYDNPREFGLNVLDFGALVCKANKPNCGFCPLAKICYYYSDNRKD